MTTPGPAWRRATAMESRGFVVNLTVAALVASQITLSLILLDRWSRLPGFALAAVQVVLAVVLSWANARGIEHTTPRMRRLALALVVTASLGNAVLLGVLINAILHGGTSSMQAPRLLGTGALVWLSNVLVFGLWYWELDRGGPAARAAGRAPVPDFLFPQMGDPEMFGDWEPRFGDYLFLAWTASTAFSPTDALPVSRWAKAAMTLQSAISLVTAALVIARAVNILG